MTDQNDNPYDPPTTDDRPLSIDGNESSAKQAYKIVSDTVIGPNVRLKDNLIQAAVIAVCLLLGAIVGAIAVEERLPGALVGGFIGLLVGLFGSGFFLMIYRAVRHLRGRHD